MESTNMIEVLPSFELDTQLFKREEKLNKAKMPITTKIRLPQTEYKPGDVISGTVIIENKSNALVNTITRSVALKSSCEIFKNETPIKLPPFLSMYDTSFTLISIPNHGTLEHHFSFKIPMYILDTYCPHQFGEHLCLPPSYGNIGHRAAMSKQINYTIEVEVESEEFIKVGKAPIKIDTSSTEFNFHQTRETTKSQLNRISRYVEDEIDVLSERKNLMKLDIDSPLAQDEIIFNGQDSSKKSQYTESEFSMVHPSTDSAISSTTSLVRSKVMPFDIEIFNNPDDGKLIASFDASLLTIDSPFPITFKFQPSTNRKEVKFPKKVSFKPKLIVINYQSLSPIPFVFDKEFMFENGFDEQNLISLRSKYGLLKQQLIDLAGQVNYSFPCNAIKMAHSLETLKAQRLSLDVLDKHEIKLKNWEFDNESNMYLCPQIISLSKSKKLEIIKPFQTCQLGRLYMLEMDFFTKKRGSSSLKLTRCPVSVGVK